MGSTAEGVIANIENLEIHFHTAKGIVRAVNGVSFDIRSGETICLVGESGAGKSVTGFSIMQLLNGGLKTDKIRQNGSITFRRKNGNIVQMINASRGSLLPIRGNEISMIYQEPMNSLNPVYTCGEQISEVIVRHGGSTRQEALVRALDLLSMVGIPDQNRILTAYPHEISGGMQQRVIIAMALAMHPRLLIADEPTTAVDVTIQAQILNLLKKIQQETGTSILFITHDIGVVAQIADRVAVMYAGLIVETCDVFSLFRKPLHPYSKGLLLATPAHTDRNAEGALITIRGTMPNPIELPAGCPFRPRCDYANDSCQILPDLKAVGNDRFVRCWNYSAMEDARR